MFQKLITYLADNYLIRFPKAKVPYLEIFIRKVFPRSSDVTDYFIVYVTAGEVRRFLGYYRINAWGIAAADDKECPPREIEDQIFEAMKQYSYEKSPEVYHYIFFPETKKVEVLG